MTVILYRVISNAQGKPGIEFGLRIGKDGTMVQVLYNQRIQRIENMFIFTPVDYGNLVTNRVEDWPDAQVYYPQTNSPLPEGNPYENDLYFLPRILQQDTYVSMNFYKINEETHSIEQMPSKFHQWENRIWFEAIPPIEAKTTSIPWSNPGFSFQELEYYLPELMDYSKYP